MAKEYSGRFDTARFDESYYDTLIKEDKFNINDLIASITSSLQNVWRELIRLTSIVYSTIRLNSRIRK